MSMDAAFFSPYHFNALYAFSFCTLMYLWVARLPGSVLLHALPKGGVQEHCPSVFAGGRAVCSLMRLEAVENFFSWFLFAAWLKN